MSRCHFHIVHFNQLTCQYCSVQFKESMPTTASPHCGAGMQHSSVQLYTRESEKQINILYFLWHCVGASIGDAKKRITAAINGDPKSYLSPFPSGEVESTPTMAWACCHSGNLDKFRCQIYNQRKAGKFEDLNCIWKPRDTSFGRFVTIHSSYTYSRWQMPNVALQRSAIIVLSFL